MTSPSEQQHPSKHAANPSLSHYSDEKALIYLLQSQGHNSRFFFFVKTCHRFTNWYLIVSHVLFVWFVPSEQIRVVCSRGWQPVSDGNSQNAFHKKCSSEVCNSTILSCYWTHSVVQGHCWGAAIKKKRQQAVLKHVPLGLFAEGAGPLQALCKSDVGKLHVTTHPFGQVTEMQQEQWAFITRFNQSLAPVLLQQHLNQNCFLTTSRPTPSHHPLLPPLSAQPVPISSWWHDPGMSPASAVTSRYTRNRAFCSKTPRALVASAVTGDMWIWEAWRGTCKNRSIRQDECSGPAPS